jgi:antitoxin ChpS
VKRTIIKIGNAEGVTIPAAFLKKLEFKAGDSVNIEENAGQIVLTKVKPKYNLKELLAKRDPDAPLNEEIKQWDQINLVGLEHDDG